MIDVSVISKVRDDETTRIFAMRHFKNIVNNKGEIK